MCALGRKALGHRYGRTVRAGSAQAGYRSDSATNQSFATRARCGMHGNRLLYFLSRRLSFSSNGEGRGGNPGLSALSGAGVDHTARFARYSSTESRSIRKGRPTRCARNDPSRMRSRTQSVDIPRAAATSLTEPKRAGRTDMSHPFQGGVRVCSYVPR